MIVAFLAMAALTMLAAPAGAQPFDHLQCFRAKVDATVKGEVDLEAAQAGFPPQAGCKIGGPVLFCTPVRPTFLDVTPAPAGAAPGPTETSHLCYKARCRRRAAPVTASDPFGTFTVKLKKGFLLCTPVGGAAATTTSTVTSATTTTTTTLGTACSARPYPTCGGACPSGFACQAVATGNGTMTQSYCTCLPVTYPCPSGTFAQCGGGLGVCPPGQACGSVVSQIATVCGCATP